MTDSQVDANIRLNALSENQNSNSDSGDLV